MGGRCGGIGKINVTDDRQIEKGISLAYENSNVAFI